MASNNRFVNLNIFEHVEDKVNDELFGTRRPYTIRVRRDDLDIWDDLDFRCRFRLKKETVITHTAQRPKDVAQASRGRLGDVLLLIRTFNVLNSNRTSPGRLRDVLGTLCCVGIIKQAIEGRLQITCNMYVF